MVGTVQVLGVGVEEDGEGGFVKAVVVVERNRRYIVMIVGILRGSILIPCS